ncbi:NAD(P)-binding protein [Athelia psychrophila]|uniref:enoyl-[acyl-carrier-protein] reductase n=1 Tax=Athelia psychrophila TaxID=1759441 RepID=A0A166XD68_9AGAM|nr:NAD(P)-binding protein [Fibularhizoctonia sp. CBS 109695]
MFMPQLRSAACSISRAQGSFSRFSTSVNLKDNRAIIYSSNGTPPDVLTAVSYPSLSDPSPNTVNIKYLLSPINPSDINVIEGRYVEAASRANIGEHSDVFVAGNEALAEVIAIGDGVTEIKKGSWVVMGKEQSGTWRSQANVRAEDLVQVPEGASEVGAATISINPPSAYGMLSQFVDLKAGDWLIQNGANSAVGQAVIQIAAARGVKTINLVRSRRDGLGALRKELYGLGATQVATYDDIAHKSFRETVKGWTKGKEILLGLNCVGGPAATDMARYLGNDAFLVSYGAMAKQPLALPTSLFIFKNLKSVGYSLYRPGEAYKTREGRDRVMHTLVGLMKEGKLKDPEHEILTLEAGESNEDVSKKIRDVLVKLSEGRYGKKVLLRVEGN